MKKLITLTAILVAICLSLYTSSCKQKNAASTGAKSIACEKITYTNTVKSILDLNCASADCHSNEKHEHGINLSHYAGSKEAGSGKSLMGSIRHEQGFDHMPEGKDKLDDATIEKLACWVENGMAE